MVSCGKPVARLLGIGAFLLMKAATFHGSTAVLSESNISSQTINIPVTGFALLAKRQARLCKLRLKLA
jgi:hypothetical protein